MNIIIRPLTANDAAAACTLLKSAYGAERVESPLLPEQLLGDSHDVHLRIKDTIRNGSVAAYRSGSMVGFMGISALFEAKGQRAALIGEVAHAAGDRDKPLIYRRLYEALGKLMRQRRAQLHIIAHFAHDAVLKETLFQLGFGAFLTERLRDLSSPESPADIPIAREDDFLALEELEREHMRYYRQSPIFLWKGDTPSEVREGLAERKAAGNALFVYRMNGAPAAYFMVGPCSGDEEGRLLKGSNTAQLASAYATSAIRRKGIGTALLAASIEWAREQGYERLFVEHESANIAGDAFWAAYFRPYLHFSMRYVEDWPDDRDG